MSKELSLRQVSVLMGVSHSQVAKWLDTGRLEDLKPESISKVFKQHVIETVLEDMVQDYIKRNEPQRIQREFKGDKTQIKPFFSQD